MESLFDQVLNTFTQNEWSYEPVEDADVLEASFQAECTVVDIHVQVFPEIQAVSVVSQSPTTTEDPDQRVKMAELMMRVNNLLTIGNFEMLWDEGQSMFRVTNLFTEPDGYDHQIVTRMVESTVVEMDRMAPLLEVITQSSPEDLVALDVEQLMTRDDLLPDVGEDES